MAVLELAALAALELVVSAVLAWVALAWVVSELAWAWAWAAWVE